MIELVESAELIELVESIELIELVESAEMIVTKTWPILFVSLSRVRGIFSIASSSSKYKQGLVCGVHILFLFCDILAMILKIVSSVLVLLERFYGVVLYQWNSFDS